MSEPEKQHIIKAFQFEVGKVTDKATRQKVVDLFNNVDNELAKTIALGVGANEPEPVERHMPKPSMSKALSLENTAKNSIATRKVAVLAMDGFSDEDLAAVKVALAAEGARVEVVSQFLSPIKSVNGKQLIPDKNLISVSSVLYDAVYIPGGEESIEAINDQGAMVIFIEEAYKHCKPIAATSEGVNLLAELGLVDSEAAGTKSNQIINELGVVALMSKPNAGFTKAFVDAMKMHRFWERENDESIPA
jgi:catalase